MRLAVFSNIFLGDSEFFDAESMAALSQGVIERAYVEGGCVIVGRGAQCILAGRPNVFRVFVYGSERERLRRIRTRVPPGADPELLLDSINDQRTRYINGSFAEIGLSSACTR
jgi:cytidylate kinase-like protein